MTTKNISLWRKRIADRKASSLKLDEWCVQNQLTKHAYYYWNRKITELDHEKSEQGLFVEISKDADATALSMNTSILIEWNDLSIQITDSHAVNLAAEFVARLKKLC